MNVESQAFPSLKLLLPPLVPAMLLASLPVGQWLGHEWSAHGDGLILGLFFQLSTVVAFVYELRVLPTAIANLRASTTNDTPFHRACILFAGLFSVACIVWLIYTILSTY